MKGRRKMLSVFTCVLMAGILWLPSGFAVHAEEEVEPPGYHEYKTTEDEAIDHWYGISRGIYLREGICTIARTGTARVGVSGTTGALSRCKLLKVTVYLDESEDGSGFGTIGTYRFSDENALSCYGSKTDIRVTKDWYYCARGVHSVTQNGVTETTNTKTNAIKAY